MGTSERAFALPVRCCSAMFGRTLNFVARNPKTFVGALAVAPAVLSPPVECNGCPIGAHSGGTRTTSEWPDIKSNRFMPDHPRGPRPKRNCAEYLNLYYLLDLQRDDEGVSVDEQHFIVVHQIFELWFKLIIQELIESSELLKQSFVPEEEIPRVVHKLKRCTEIFRHLAQQWKVVETLQPQDFLAFRDNLGTASGFESFQIRQLEMMVGMTQEDRVKNFQDPMQRFKEMAEQGNDGDKTVYMLMQKVSNATPLNQVLNTWLQRTPIDGSLPSDDGDDIVVARFVQKYLDLHQEMQDQSITRMEEAGMALERIQKVKTMQEHNRKQAVDWLQPEGDKIDR